MANFVSVHWLGAFFCMVVAITSFVESRKHHQCNQNMVEAHPWRATNIPYKNHPYDKSLDVETRRRLALVGETYENIRITPHWNLDGLSNDDEAYVKATVSTAIDYLSQFTKVVPIDGTFFVPRPCVDSVEVGIFAGNDFINCVEYNINECGPCMLCTVILQ